LFGISNANGILNASDCNYIASTRTTGSPADAYSIYVPNGRTLHVTVTAIPGGPPLQPLIDLRDGFSDAASFTNPVLASNSGDTPSSTGQLTYVGTGSYIKIWVTARAQGGVGPYTITIDP
jgi:hypothetical protein